MSKFMKKRSLTFKIAFVLALITLSMNGSTFPFIMTYAHEGDASAEDGLMILNEIGIDITNKTIQAGVLEESIVLMTNYAGLGAVSWSLENEMGANFQLENITDDGGAVRVRFDNYGAADILLESITGEKARVMLNVNSQEDLSSAYIDGSASNKIYSGQTITLEKGSSFRIDLNLYDQSNLKITKSGEASSYNKSLENSVYMVIDGEEAGLSEYSLEIFSKIITFTVEVEEPSNLRYYMRGQEVNPMIIIEAGKTEIVSCNMEVEKWVLQETTTGVSVSKIDNKTVQIMGITANTMVSVNAYDLNNVKIGQLNVFVNNGESELFAEILLENDHDSSDSYIINLNESKKFIVDCTVIEGITQANWRLEPISGAGEVSCAELEIEENYYNGLHSAKVTALSGGTCRLVVEANGVTSSALLTIEGGSGPKWFINLKEAEFPLFVETGKSYDIVVMDKDNNFITPDLMEGEINGLIQINFVSHGLANITALQEGEFFAKATIDGKVVEERIKIADAKNVTTRDMFDLDNKPFMFG